MHAQPAEGLTVNKQKADKLAWEKKLGGTTTKVAGRLTQDEASRIPYA